jgi:hypothetical protein
MQETLSYPTIKGSITEFSSVLNVILVIDGDTEEIVPGSLLVSREPSGPTVYGIILCASQLFRVFDKCNRFLIINFGGLDELSKSG